MSSFTVVGIVRRLTLTDNGRVIVEVLPDGTDYDPDNDYFFEYLEEIETSKANAPELGEHVKIKRTETVRQVVTRV